MPQKREPLPEVRLLRLFEMLYQTGSVSGAADRLGLSQPTASMQLAELRRLMDDPLFIRMPNGMQPTARAQQVIGTVRLALDAIRQLTSPHIGFLPESTERVFRLHMAPGSHIALLPPILSRIRARAKGIRISVSPITPQTVEALRSGEADLAIGYASWLTASFHQEVLYRQDWVCLVSTNHPRIGSSLSLEEYSSESHVHVIQGTSEDLLSDAVGASGIRRDVVLQLPGPLGLSAVVADSDLVATLPRHIAQTLVERGRNMRVVPCPFPIPDFNIYQYWHVSADNDPGHLWLREIVSDAFHNHDVFRAAEDEDSVPPPGE